MIIHDDGSKEFKLPSGAVARVMPGKGKHAMEAIAICDGNTKKYMAALMMQLVTIDAKPQVLEDFEDMPLADYMKLQSEFSDQNFTSPAGM